MYGKIQKLKKNLGLVVWWLHIQSGQSCVGVSCMLVGCELNTSVLKMCYMCVGRVAQSV